MARYIICEACDEEKHDDHFGEFEICSECAVGMGADGGAEVERLNDRIKKLEVVLKAAQSVIDANYCGYSEWVELDRAVTACDLQRQKNQ